MILLFLVSSRHDGQASRDRILATVRAEPGIHVSDLVKRTGLSWHTVAYHLRILQKGHALHVDKGGRERRAYPAGIPDLQRAWLAALRTTSAAEVLRMLVDDPRQSIPGLSRRMGFSEKVVRRQMANLAQAGLVDRHGQLRPVYELNPLAVEEVRAWLRSVERLPTPPGQEGPAGGPKREGPALL